MGGDAHGHGHHEPYKVPDYRIYKVEDVPRLFRIQKLLASQGLRDPWLRNEVWRFAGKDERFFHNAFFRFVPRGFKIGVAAFLITIAGTAAYDRLVPSDHGHHDH